jgi:hypothetical protein
MKRYFAAIIFIVGLTNVFASTVLSEDVKPERHWYRLELQTGDTTYQCIGTSMLDEKEFARMLSGSELVLLDDVAYIDNNSKVKNWQEWDPKSSSRLYVNPRYVIFFNPMKGDPRKATSGKTK